MADIVTVGQFGPFGSGADQCILQIWQMLLDARTGSVPLQVTGGSGGSFDVKVYALPQVLTDGATVTFDVSKGVNASWTIAGNNTLSNPANLYAGASGNIAITQGSGGSHVAAFGGNWQFPGGTTPTLSTAAGAVDLLSWYSPDGTNVFAVLNNAFAA